MASRPPLTGTRVLELAGLAPGPFCGVLLSSYGAEVLRIDRPGNTLNTDLLANHKSSLVIDLKAAASVALFKSLLPKADVVIDPFRPGVLERLGLDPDTVLLKINPRLIIVRLTGFRRDGKYKDMAGHDINYLAVSGVLNMLGPRGKPPLHPGNILADFAGGGLVAFVGVLLALMHRSETGKGQVVEANMVDGVAFLGTLPRLLTKSPTWNAERGTNGLDGGAPYYGCYECRDAGRYMAVGSLEPEFYAKLVKGLGLDPSDLVPRGLDRLDKRSWPHMREVLTQTFKTKTRSEWEGIFDGSDACATPVLDHGEMERARYEQRPLVGLVASPARKLDTPWDGKALKPGDGGKEVLREWMGWERDQNFEIAQSGVFNKISKL